MSGRRTLLVAVGLAEEAEARLVARGLPPSCLPPHAEILDAVWPVAKRLVRAEKLAKRTRKTAELTRALAEQAALAAEGAVDDAAGRWQHATASSPRLIPFDARDWSLALLPAGGAREREAA